MSLEQSVNNDHARTLLENTHEVLKLEKVPSKNRRDDSSSTNEQQEAYKPEVQMNLSDSTELKNATYRRKAKGRKEFNTSNNHDRYSKDNTANDLSSLLFRTSDNDITTNNRDTETPKTSILSSLTEGFVSTLKIKPKAYNDNEVAGQYGILNQNKQLSGLSTDVNGKANQMPRTESSLLNTEKPTIDQKEVPKTANKKPSSEGYPPPQQQKVLANSPSLPYQNKRQSSRTSGIFNLGKLAAPSLNKLSSGISDDNSKLLFMENSQHVQRQYKIPRQKRRHSIDVEFYER